MEVYCSNQSDNETRERCSARPYTSCQAKDTARAETERSAWRMTIKRTIPLNFDADVQRSSAVCRTGAVRSPSPPSVCFPCAQSIIIVSRKRTSLSVSLSLSLYLSLALSLSLSLCLCLSTQHVARKCWCNRAPLPSAAGPRTAPPQLSVPPRSARGRSSTRG